MSAGYVVVATRLDTVDDNGRRTKHYRGEKVTGLSAADVKRFKAAGAIADASTDEAAAAKADPAEANPAETSAAEAVTEPAKTGLPEEPASAVVPAVQSEANTAEAPKRPANTATAAVWREYAVASGQFTADEAADLTRDELRDRLK
ncbi:hypothetical protein SEA_GANCHO_9 [Mycobacterium phage Gancho]|uniref:Head-to-tail connector protein n=1 Tax=Mycobacterium phage Gancho TaxID=2301613 RepID=A0A385UC94_9CAUD|nr:hypothetical protein SEA_GANCHO_9 [Mycobacterium phage Gancho]